MANPHEPSRDNFAIGDVDRRAPARSRIIGVRHVLANVILFVAYLVGVCLVDWLDIVCSPHNAFIQDLLSLLGPLIALSTFPVVCGVNWMLTSYPHHPLGRAIIGCLLGLIAIASLFWPFVTLYLDFHTMIGGSL
jgi:hypothetical protein